MLSENIKAIRKAKGLSQEELAIKLSVVRQTISKWEKGLSVPDAGTLIKIADALDTTVNVLLGEVPLEPDEQEPVQAIAAKLELLNEQLAKRSERNRKIWRMVFVGVGVFALIGIVKEILGAVHLYQTNEMLNSTEAIIGGADVATSILVSNITFQEFSFAVTIIAAIAAVIGIYHTRRK